MADLRFASWARTAVGAAVGDADEGGALAAPAVRPVAHLGTTLDPAGRDASGPALPVLGPGDVVGFDLGLVARLDPTPGTGDFTDTDLAAIELASIELPWLLSPARAGSRGRLRPWIVLVVVEAATALVPGPVLPSIEVDVAELPDLADSWGWAHVQLPAEGATPPPGFEALVGVQRSRLVCPRRLAPGTAYRACVVPAFAGGRAAGLGERGAATASLAPAWDVAGGGRVQLPVYFQWEFATGEAGSFEQLVRRLAPADVAALPGFGVREIDIARPWEHDRPLADTPQHLDMQGVLRGPDDVFGDPDANQAMIDFFPRIAEHVNAPGARLDGSLDPASPARAVAPPIWGGRHNQTNHVHPLNELPLPDLDWLTHLNLDPRQRVAASLGAQYVQAHQEQLMAHAWEQVGPIREANRRRAWAEMAAEVLATLHRRHVSPLGIDQAMALAAPAADRVRTTDDGPSLAAEVRYSRLADAAVTTSFARLLRPRGRLARRAGTSATLAGRGLLGQVTVTDPAPVIRAEAFTTGATGDGPMATLAVDAVTTLAATNVSSDLAGLRVLADVARANGFAQVPSQVEVAVETTASSASVPMSLLQASSVGEVAPLVAPVVADVALAVATTVDGLSAEVLPDTRSIDRFGVSVDSEGLRARLVEQLRPGDRPARRLDATVHLPPHVRSAGPLAPVMTSPRFPVPLATVLVDASPEWFLPGIGAFPANRAVLLQVNARFVESFMVGANHEMMSELRWREYPTDLRGTPFSRFWPRPGGEDDIPPLAGWFDALGHHLTLAADAMAVLVVRGDVIRRFPDLVVRAVRAQPGVLPPTPVVTPGPEEVRDPLFLMRIDPSTAVYAFAVPPAELEATPSAEATGWFIVLQENAARIRFGFDAGPEPPPPLASWNDLTWAHVVRPDRPGFAFAGLDPAPVTDPPSPAAWNTDAADVARISLQHPFRVALHSTRLVGHR